MLMAVAELVAGVESITRRNIELFILLYTICSGFRGMKVNELGARSCGRQKWFHGLTC